MGMRWWYMLMGESASIVVEPPLFNDSHLDLGLKLRHVGKGGRNGPHQMFPTPNFLSFFFSRKFNPFSIWHLSTNQSSDLDIGRIIHV